MLALISNYKIPLGFDYSEPYSKMLKVIEGTFGKSKKIEWWLEHTFNHSPRHFMVWGQRLPWCKHADEDISSGLHVGRNGYTTGTTRMTTTMKISLFGGEGREIPGGVSRMRRICTLKNGPKLYERCTYLGPRNFSVGIVLASTVRLEHSKRMIHGATEGVCEGCRV